VISVHCENLETFFAEIISLNTVGFKILENHSKKEFRFACQIILFALHLTTSGNSFLQAKFGVYDDQLLH
jgi:hypothetical protein